MTITEDMKSRLYELIAAATTAEKARADTALDTASELVQAELDSWPNITIPDSVTQQAIFETASNLYQRRNAHNGIMSIDMDDVQPFKVNKDPLAWAREILRPYIPAGMGIA